MSSNPSNTDDHWPSSVGLVAEVISTLIELSSNVRTAVVTYFQTGNGCSSVICLCIVVELVGACPAAVFDLPVGPHTDAEYFSSSWQLTFLGFHQTTHWRCLPFHDLTSLGASVQAHFWPVAFFGGHVCANVNSPHSHTPTQTRMTDPDWPKLPPCLYTAAVGLRCSPGTVLLQPLSVQGLDGVPLPINFRSSPNRSKFVVSTPLVR